MPEATSAVLPLPTAPPAAARQGHLCREDTTQHQSPRPAGTVTTLTLAAVGYKARHHPFQRRSPLRRTALLCGGSHSSGKGTGQVAGGCVPQAFGVSVLVQGVHWMGWSWDRLGGEGMLYTV